MARARERTAAVPVGEELEALARHYHDVQGEHQNARPESSLRRRLEDKLLDVRHRFDRLLDEWVPDEEVRTAWRAYLDHHAPRPDEPGVVSPVVSSSSVRSTQPRDCRLGQRSGTSPTGVNRLARCCFGRKRTRR